MATTGRRRRALLGHAVLPGLLLLAGGGGAPGAEVDRLEQWAQWRGPLGTGVAPRARPPLEWSEDRNVRWKVPIPGRGLSSPVVWEDQVFLTTAIPHGEAAAGGSLHDADGAHDNVLPLQQHRFVVLSIDGDDGRVRWERTVRDERPHEGTHLTGSWASASAVTDGRRVYASFGSRGIYAMDMDGDLVWETDLGDMQIFHGHGEGSSPALHGDALVLNWDHQGGSFLIALDASTGKVRWKVAREEITSWSTPLIVMQEGKPQVVVSATNRVRGYDLSTGEEIWSVGGLSRNVVATPVSADGIVFVGSSYDTRAMLAIRLAGARGDLTGTDAILWRRDRDTPYVPSPVLYDDLLCFLKHLQGILTCVEPRTGATVLGPERLGGAQSVFASPVGAAGRLYIPSRDGVTVVVRSDAPFEVLARNVLDDSFSASPAVVGDSIYLRGEKSLYRLALPTGPPAPREPAARTGV